MVNSLTNQPPELKIFQNFLVKYDCFTCFPHVSYGVFFKGFMMIKKFLEKVEMRYNYNELLKNLNIFM